MLLGFADYSDPQNFLEVFSAEDNDGQYHSDDYNELIARIRTTPNGAERDALMHQAEKDDFDESLVMPLYFTTQPYVTNGTIQNYFWTTLGLVDFKKHTNKIHLRRTPCVHCVRIYLLTGIF